MASILIGGTPGTGKTKVAKILGSRLSIDVIALGELAGKSGCISAQDKARDTGIIDEDCLVEAIIDLVDDKSKRFVIEGHYIDLVPSSSVQWVFILRTHPETLTARLTERGYKEEKVKENVEAEVLGVCQLDALDAFGEERVLEIDTSEMTPPDVASMIEQMMRDEPAPNRIDWMVDLEKEGRLDEFLIE
ncbi:MAG: adenylate kinase family protein [Candidatus Thorarchaeota archaeon]|nr:adenylate kinase family protein [Candidatus Thorarchaeota archaeon]